MLRTPSVQQESTRPRLTGPPALQLNFTFQPLALRFAIVFVEHDRTSSLLNTIGRRPVVACLTRHTIVFRHSARISGYCAAPPTPQSYFQVLSNAHLSCFITANFFHLIFSFLQSNLKNAISFIKKYILKVCLVKKKWRIIL